MVGVLERMECPKLTRREGLSYVSGVLTCKEKKLPKECSGTERREGGKEMIVRLRPGVERVFWHGREGDNYLTVCEGCPCVV